MSRQADLHEAQEDPVALDVDHNHIDIHTLTEVNDMKFCIHIPKLFEAFRNDTSTFALALHLSHHVEKLLAIPKHHDDFRRNLIELERLLNREMSTYWIIRKDNAFVLVTFAPWRSPTASHFIQNRGRLARLLGEYHFEFMMICREPVEVTDYRSWDERIQLCKDYESKNQGAESVRDIGYLRTKCRLCDRRMKNKITQEAVIAFGTLKQAKTVLQLCLDLDSMDTLILRSSSKEVQPDQVASQWKDDYPSFTFYRHPDTYLLYFIYYCPDRATVQQRMRHTMAVPGLVNIIAQEQNVHVDQKLEIHDREDVVFEATDKRIGKYRSMYLRNRFNGTESTYANLDQDNAFYESISAPKSWD